MNESGPPTGAPDQSNPPLDVMPPPTGDKETQGGRDRRRNQKRREGSVECGVCRRKYARITAEHLRKHGLTRQRYNRIYGDARSSGSPDQLRSAREGAPAMVLRLSEEISGSAAFLDALSSEVADHLLSSGPLRQQVALAAAQIVQARMAIHADAAGRLARVTQELDEPWRIKQAGPGGKPTPTKDLLGMAAQAHAEIVKAEEMVLKAARLALDEQKQAAVQRVVPGFAYSGEAEAIPIPRDLSASDREGLRALVGNLQRFVKARREVVDVEPTAIDPVPPTSIDPVPQAPAIEMTATLPEASAPTTPRRRRRRRKDPLIRSPTDPVSPPQPGPNIGGEGGVSDSGGGA